MSLPSSGVVVSRHPTAVRALRLVVPSAAAIVLIAGGAAAQSPATTLPELAGRIKPGTKVIVTTDDGGKFDGRFVTASVATLVLDADQRHSIPASDVATVTRKGKRPILKGTLIGLGIGAGLGLVEVLTDDCPKESCILPGFEYAFAGSMLAIGAGAGAGIGALVPPRQTVVYRAPPRAGSRTLGLVPRVAFERAGLEVRVTF
jgi:hypothetical protein